MILCRILGVSTSGYYSWRSRGPSNRDIANDELTRIIIKIHEASRGTYGVPRVHAELVMGQGIRCSRNRVARLMSRAGLQGVHRRRLHGITHRDRSKEPSPDLVKRQFTSECPDQLWVADMTEHPTAEGKVYLSAVIDIFSRKVVGWSMGDRPLADLVVGAVNMAVWNRQPNPGLIHHSDHGAQYTSLVMGRTLREAGILGSMGTVGDALDNAVAESFFATLQTELLNRHTWSTRQELMSAIFDYVEAFYNRRRRHSTLGYLSPDEFERGWLLSQETSERSVA